MRIRIESINKIFDCYNNLLSIDDPLDELLLLLLGDRLLRPKLPVGGKSIISG